MTASPELGRPVAQARGFRGVSTPVNRTIPISLDYGTAGQVITGQLVVATPNGGTIVLKGRPLEVSFADARTALKCAVIDGRIKLDADVQIALDLIGSSPKVF